MSSTTPRQIPLFDALMREYKLGNDTQLAKFTNTHAAVICRIRYGDLQIKDGLICRIARATGWDIPRIDALAAKSNK